MRFGHICALLLAFAFTIRQGILYTYQLLFHVTVPHLYHFQALHRTLSVTWDAFVSQGLSPMKLQCLTVAVRQTLSHTDLHWILNNACHAMVSSGPDLAKRCGFILSLSVHSIWMGKKCH